MGDKICCQYNQMYIQIFIFSSFYFHSGPKATESFAKLALGGTKPSGGFGIISLFQDWFNAEVRPKMIILNLHVIKDTFDMVKLCLEESDTLKPSGLKAEAIGIKSICQLLDRIIEKVC